MNPITKALASGYTAEKILGYLSKTIPELSKKIGYAQNHGHSTEGILEFLSSKMDRKTHEKFRFSDDVSVEKKREKEQLTKDLLSKGIKYGTMAFGAYTMARMAPAVARNLPYMAPFLEKMGFGGEGETPGAGGIEKATEQISTPTGELTETVDEEREPQLPGFTDPDVLRKNILDKEKLTNKLRVLAKSKSREEMLGFLKKKMSRATQEYVRSIGPEGTPGDLDTKLMAFVDMFFPKAPSGEGQPSQGGASDAMKLYLAASNQLKQFMGG